jgi:hypothetical protein
MFLPPFCQNIGKFESEQLIPGVVARGEGEKYSPLPVPNHKELRQGHVLGHLGVIKYTCSGHKISLWNNQREKRVGGMQVDISAHLPGEG